MARPLRLEFEGALYHLTGRGNVRQRIFANQKDCAKFVQRLRESLQRYDLALHGYVLMGNHYHLIAETRRANLGGNEFTVLCSVSSAARNLLFRS